jgi:PAS domain S-box-containing protein
MEFIAPESRKEVMRDFMQVAQGHDAYLAHYYVISAKGKKIYVESIGKVITYEGKPADLISIRDITEQKKAEDALKESEQKHRILLDESSDPIFSFYPDGTYRYVNRAFAEGVGKSVDQILGKKIWDIFPQDEAEKRFSALRTVFASGNRHEFEVRVPRPDGDRYYITTIVPVKDDTGTVVSAICSSKEITARKQVEEALWQANKKLNLLSGVTRHDIRNQLFALNGFLELLHKKTLNSDLEEYFTRITKTSERIAAMIEFTREYEKIGVTVPAWHDCHTLVDTATRQAPLGRVMVKNDLPAGTEIFVDPLITKVFYNLMDNAARYGGKISIIRFTLEERNGDRIIICEDDGNGIPAEEKKRIFERGYGKNTGLGLAISREILDITGITIRETGEPGKGARFEIVVPKDRVRFNGE